MIEPIMYFGIGFLVAALVGLVVIPLVHGRAVRLTMRRLEAATPLSMAEIQADKDQLRAEFAMSTRRLEVSVENLRTKSTSQLAELGKKGDAINRLKIELGEKTATIFALEARDKALRDQLRTTEEEFSVKTSAMLDAQRALNDKEAELAKLMGELDERSSVAEAQKIDIVALKTQVDALKERLTDASNELKTVEDRRDSRTRRTQGRDPGTQRRARQGREPRPPRLRTRTGAGGADHRSRNSRPPRPRSGKPARRAVARCSTKANSNSSQLRAEYETRPQDRSRSARRDRRTRRPRQFRDPAVARRERPAAGRSSNAPARSATASAREFGNMKREAEESWASERVENALLRERINDVAAEVARLASALEGPNSPIDAILAAETARDRASLEAVDSRHRCDLGRDRAGRRQPRRPHPRAADPRLALPNEDEPKAPN